MAGVQANSEPFGFADLGENLGQVLEAMTYRDGALELKASAPSVESLDQLSRQLRQQGWQARLIAGTPKGSSYEGSIQMSPGS